MTFPPDFTYPAEKTVTAHLAAERIAALAADRRAVVQAGGCSGLWPLALAQVFAQVYTFEPDPVNFQCLAANVASQPNISAWHAAIGEAPAHVGLVRPRANAGLWRVDGEGEIPMVRLDDLIDGPVDALVLDVEGSELSAFRGAERLIATHQPLLWFEYLHHATAIDAFLAAHGYATPRQGMGGDAYSLHTSRMN